MSQFLYRIQPVRHDMLANGSTEFESRIVSEHFNYLKQLATAGVVILAGRTQNTDYSSFGIVVFNAKTVEEAREIMLNDPAVKNKVFRAELFPYKMALFGPENSKSD
ncbi:MAG TPA: YciI family protein [Candidatus Bathyarchaeia archaeon]|nr:YciI family protein [Candidatus Bathyarchaeia archaeon]